MATRNERLWHIEGYDSMEKIYDRKINVSQMTEKQVKAMLMTLAAKAGLDFDEIVGAYATQRTKIRNELLVVRRDGSYPVFTCGSNPHFIVRVINA